MFQISYGHLYNTSTYSPVSTNRQIRRATPNSSQQIGEHRLPDNNNSGGTQTMNTLVNNKLRGRDVYNKMRNKTIYGNSSKIRMHAELNQL